MSILAFQYHDHHDWIFDHVDTTKGNGKHKKGRLLLKLDERSQSFAVAKICMQSADVFYDAL